MRMENKEAKKAIHENWKVWVILIIIAISIIAIKAFEEFGFEPETKKTSEVSSKNIHSKSISDLTYPELRYFLEKQGYTFETTTIESLNWTSFSNKSVAISATIEIESYKYVITYWDKSLEGDACCITDTSANTSKEKKQHYDSYLKWKDDIGLTQEQIKEVLLKYYLEKEEKSN